MVKKGKREEKVSSSRLFRSSEPLSENKGKWKYSQILGPCYRTKNTGEHKGDGNANSSLYALNCPKQIEKESNWSHSDFGIVEIRQNTESWRSTVTQIQMKAHHLTLVWILAWSKIVIIIIWDFVIKTNHTIPFKRLDLGFINKKKKVLN